MLENDRPHQSLPLIEIWLVEDHDLFRETIGDLVDGAEGMSCSRRFEAFEHLLPALGQHPPPDLVLMDIGLPGVNGIEGTRQLKAALPDLPVLMLTVHRDNDLIVKAICAGASGYLLKTSPPSSVIEAIRQVQGGGAPIDAQIARRVLDMFAKLAAPQHDYGLSDREKEILEYLVTGLTKKRIADALHLSPHTIDGHVRNIYAKLEVHTRSGAVAKALRENLL